MFIRIFHKMNRTGKIVLAAGSVGLLAGGIALLFF